MFSIGHIVFIIFSFLIVFFGVLFCKKNKIPTDKIVFICFFIGIICEIVKIFAVIELVPILELVNENGAIIFNNTGKFSPYIEAYHLPYELCSFQIIFMALAYVVKNEKWKRRIYSVIYGTALIGGILAVLLSSIAPEFDTITEFLLSVRAWEFYVYHAMIIIVSIVIALDKKINLIFADVKWTCLVVLVLDTFSFYMNSIFSSPIYQKGTLLGLTYSLNYFSSYQNPLRINITTKTEYLIYILIRFVIGLLFILVAYIPFLKRKREDI